MIIHIILSYSNRKIKTFREFLQSLHLFIFGEWQKAPLPRGEGREGGLVQIDIILAIIFISGIIRAITVDAQIGNTFRIHYDHCTNGVQPIGN